MFSVTANGGKLNRFSLRQSFNFPAIRNLLTLFKQPSLILPHISLNKLSELDVERLKAKGIKYIVFDKDNTLTRAFEDELHPDILNTFNEISHHFPGNVAILSNSVGSSDDTDYAEAGMSLFVAHSLLLLRYNFRQMNSRINILIELSLPLLSMHFTLYTLQLILKKSWVFR